MHVCMNELTPARINHACIGVEPYNSCMHYAYNVYAGGNAAAQCAWPQVLFDILLQPSSSSKHIYGTWQSLKNYKKTEILFKQILLSVVSPDGPLSTRHMKRQGEIVTRCSKRMLQEWILFATTRTECQRHCVRLKGCRGHCM